MIGLKLNKNWN